MSVLLHGEADAAGRAGRLRQAQSILESDWRALVLHASSRAALGRPASRLFSRLRWIPLSHHHRFPLYEKVHAYHCNLAQSPRPAHAPRCTMCCPFAQLTMAAEERNARVEPVDLMFPPEMVKNRQELHGMLADINTYLDLSNVQGIASLGEGAPELGIPAGKR